MIKRLIAGATVAITATLGLTAAAQAAPGASTARPVPRARVINLHRTFEAKLGHVKVGKPSGIVYALGKQPKAANRVQQSCTEPNCPLIYNGGPVQHSPHIYLLLWGPNWSTASQTASAAYLENFYAGLGVEPQDNWSTTTSQYGDVSGFPTFTGSVYMGAFTDTSTPPSGTTDAQFAAEADAFASNQNITDLNDAQVVIATQSGTCPSGFYAPNCAGGTGTYCAYHDASTVPFTNLPYILDAGQGCGEDFINSNGTDDGFSIVGGHEYAESVTDPIPPSGWIDQNDQYGGEIGDKCAWGGELWGGNDPAGDVTLSTGTFAMQSLWSNSANQCVMATSAGQDTVTVTNPGNQTGTIGSPVSLQIQGSSSGGNPLTWSAVGLPTGLSIGSSTGVIAGTPTTANTYNVTVTAKDSTGASGSASFTWAVNCGTDTVTVTNPGNQTGTVGTPVTLQLQGTSSCGSPLTWSATVLPSGTSLNAGTGLISGTPTTVNTYDITVTAKDASGISGSASFTWTINPASGHPIKGDHGMCLDDHGSVTTNGNKIDIWTCNGTAAQKWTYNSNSTLSVLGKCLSDKYYTGAGTKLVLWSCIGNRNEQWKHLSNGEYKLATNGLCLTDPSGSTVDGTQVEIRACNDFRDQRWSGP